MFQHPAGRCRVLLGAFLDKHRRVAVHVNLQHILTDGVSYGECLIERVILLVALFIDLQFTVLAVNLNIR